MNTILSVDNLEVIYHEDRGASVKAVSGVSFALGETEILGITGQSGSGKTTILLAIANLLPANGLITSGELSYDGQKISASEGLPRKYLGRDIGFVFQDPLAALNPVFTIGFHFSEILRFNSGLNKADSIKRALELLEAVKIKNPEKCLESYPHQLSGGMRQRVMLALSLSCRPKIVLADEPTSSLDLFNAAEIINLIRSLKEWMGFSVIIVSHDIDMLVNNCDRLLVLHQGNIIEEGAPLFLKQKTDLNHNAKKLLNYEKYY